MISELRKKFNSEFKQQTYDDFLNELNSILKYPTDFRVSETPVFMSAEFKSKLENACDDIITQLRKPSFIDISDAAIPKELKIPNESDHPEFLQIDFAVCEDEKKSLIPKLVELQAFPTIYSYQYYYSKVVRKHFNINENLSPYFNSPNEISYKNLLQNIIVADSDPGNVILLEIEPAKQKTRIDFAATEELLGIKELCISNVIQKGRKLFYKNEGKLIPIERIYNRVIFDELESSKAKFSFNYKDDLDVKWVTHPNWFFKISKFSLPLLSGKYVPECYYLNEVNKISDDLSNYVLKPLFSFAGHGVDIDPTKEKIISIKDKENYILQHKIEYAPVIETPSEKSKMEIRMMFLWDKEPLLVNNLVRMSKGKMMGVDFNKNKTWVGSSQAFHFQ